MLKLAILLITIIEQKCINIPFFLTNAKQQEV